MRVLLQRPAPDWFGGGVVHVEKTREHLARLGVEVECAYDLAPDLRDYDLVHLFNTPKTDHLFLQCANAQRQSRPIVLSSIYWDEERLSSCLSAAAPLPPGARLDRALALQLYGAVLGEADLVLTASVMEQGWLARDFGVTADKARVVPLAAEPFFAEADAEPFVERFGVRDFVLCAGALMPAKNQLRLIAALRDFGAPLVLAYSQADPSYEERCRAEARDNVLFVGHLEQRELACAYAAAKVHALVSFYEPTGLVTLEAGLAGCNLVCTAHSPIVEYVGNRAWYADPLDLASIRRAVELAHRVPKSHLLRSELLTNFTWERSAQATLAAYEALLAASARLTPRKGETRYRWLIAFHGNTKRLRSAAAETAAEARAAALPSAEGLDAQALRRALAQREAQLRAVTSTWAYRLHHRLALSLPARLARRLRAPGPPPTFPAPHWPALDALASRRSIIKRALVLATASAWHVRRALRDLERALPQAQVVLAGPTPPVEQVASQFPQTQARALTRGEYAELTGLYDVVVTVGRVGEAEVSLAERVGARLVVQYNTDGYFAGAAVIMTPARWRRTLRRAAMQRPAMLAAMWLLTRVYAGYFRVWDLLRRKERRPVTCIGCGRNGRAAVHWGPRHDPPYVTCPRCGLVQLSAPRSESELSRIYNDTQAIHAYLQVRDEPVTRARHERILARIERWARPGRLLDVGCADGRFLEVARDAGWKIAGVESSPALVRRVRNALGQVEVYQGVVGEVELPRQHFDAINLCHMLERVPEVRRLLRKCFDALKPGGVLCIVTPNIESFAALVTRDQEQRCLTLTLGHISVPTIRRTRALLRAQGFQVLESGTQASGRIHQVLWTSRLLRFLPAALRRPIERREPQLSEYLAAVGMGEEHYVVARKPLRAR